MLDRTHTITVLVTVAVLTLAGAFVVYFGTLNPGHNGFVPDRCTFEAGIDCMDFVYVSNGSQSLFKVLITNMLDREMEIVSVRLDSTAFPGPCEALYDEPQAISNATQHLILAQGPGCATTDEKLRADVELDYLVSDNRDVHTILGEIIVRNP